VTSICDLPRDVCKVGILPPDHPLKKLNLQVNSLYDYCKDCPAPQGAMSITVKSSDIGNAMGNTEVNRCKHLRRWRGKINIPIRGDNENFWVEDISRSSRP
jgi:hypothetical protein